MNRYSSYFGILVFLVLNFGWGQASNSGSNAKAIQGKFPIEKVISINSGYFRNEAFQDLLVTHEVGTIKISTGSRFRTGQYSLHQKTLLGFANGKFESFWQSPPYIAKSSPSACIYSTAWCVGNFDKDPLLELVELDNGWATIHEFDQGVVTSKRIESNEGAIDQAIGWNFDGKGEEEILALKFSWEASEEKTKRTGGPSMKNRAEIGCGSLPKRGYRISVLTLANGKIAEVWAGDFGDVSSFSPIGGAVLFGKMIIDGGGDLHPVLRGPQSDVSGSRYILVSKAKDGKAVEITHPFPVEGGVLPIGDLTFLQFDQRGTVVHGTFLNQEKEFRLSKTIGSFRNGKWAESKHCEKAFPGSLEKFEIEKNRKGWIHVHEGKFRIWQELPDCED